jgi:hypothetical protein
MNITFVITSYQDSVLAAQSAAAAKTLYPSAQIVQLSDLPPNRLKLPQFSGQWTERWMKAALATNADIIIKIDPDTRAYNAVTTFPTTDIFGQIAQNGIYGGLKGVIHGAAIGFQRAAVEKIVASGLLSDKKYTVKPYTTTRGLTETISLQDPIVHDVATRLGLTMGAWAGTSIRTKWQGKKTVDTTKVTFAHPVKD